MRQLTKKQKKILNEFIEGEILPKSDLGRLLGNGTFKGGKFVLDMKDLPYNIVQDLEEINDTEILYQEIDRYLHDESIKVR